MDALAVAAVSPVVLGVPGALLGLAAGRAARRRPPDRDEAVQIAIGLGSLVGMTVLALSAFALGTSAESLVVVLAAAGVGAIANGAAAAGAFLAALRRGSTGADAGVDGDPPAL